MSQLHPLRHLPAVNDLLETPRLKSLIDSASHAAVVQAARSTIDELRAELKAAGAAADVERCEVQAVAERVASKVESNEVPALRPVVNATGILLHTGLGRAPLAQAALDAMADVSQSYASVELNLDSGKRSQRAVAVEGLLIELTGAEAALVVNNNAGATLLTLAAMAAEREVIVSRGELIEIGGSFRLPDVMSVSRAKLHEVGTTNKTRPSDYEQAINETTAALLLVHPSNYAVVGFSQSTSLEDLLEVGRKHNLPVIHDIGSGALIDFAEFGFPEEPVAPASVAAGADVVLFSGDKLLGGPQAGIIVGRKEYVAAIASHPLARAFRVDKLTLAALRATLQLYRQAETVRKTIPLLELLSTEMSELRTRAESIAASLNALPGLQTEVTEGSTFLGGGSVPAQELPTVAVSIELSKDVECSIDQFAAELRQHKPAVVGRINQDRLLLDLRSVFPREDGQLVAAVRHACNAQS